MMNKDNQPDRKEALRQTRKLLESLGLPKDGTPDGVTADIWEREDRIRRLEQVRARQLAVAFKSGKG